MEFHYNDNKRSFVYVMSIIVKTKKTILYLMNDAKVTQNTNIKS